jgi:hypothetical protein
MQKFSQFKNARITNLCSPTQYSKLSFCYKNIPIFFEIIYFHINSLVEPIKILQVALHSLRAFKAVCAVPQSVWVARVAHPPQFSALMLMLITTMVLVNGLSSIDPSDNSRIVNNFLRLSSIQIQTHSEIIKKNRAI